MSNMQQILRGVACRDLRSTLQNLNTEGWDITRTSNGHLKLTNPEALRPVFSSSTPSDVRGMKNLVSECRGVIRAKTNQQVEEEAAKTSSPKSIDLRPRTQRKKKKRWSDKKKMMRDIETRMETAMIPQTLQTNKPKETPVETQFTAPKKKTVKPAPTPKPIAMPKPAPAADEKTTAPKPQPVAAPAPTAPAPVSVVSAEALALAMRIVSGEMKTLEITQDMVGAKIAYDGNISLIGGEAAQVAENARSSFGMNLPVSDMEGMEDVQIPVPSKPTPKSADLANAEYREGSKIAKLRERTLTVMKTMGNEWLSTAEIVSLIEVEDLYSSPNGLRVAMQKNLQDLVQSGGAVSRPNSDGNTRSLQFKLT
ncbi:MAG: hypothetical protein ABJN42_10520 [Roseibium sp.]|uniref:hypothetical protein n=1 Tax=Roseibium sp. TaxID=1936156 RepID=UPI003297B286